MQSLPGFRDFLPDDCARRNYIFARWREVARRYGFVEWEGPPLEATELYKKKSGGEIVEQLFNFTDKGDREVALRPELTPTLARVIAAHEREFKKPLNGFPSANFFVMKSNNAAVYANTSNSIAISLGKPRPRRISSCSLFVPIFCA